METANLLSLLKSFSKTEAREVRRFLQSPFFNQRDDLRALFDFLFQTENPQKEAAWSVIFPEKKYDDTAMRLLMSYLNRLLEQYLTIKENGRDDLRNKLQLAVAYRRRGLLGQYHRTINALERHLNNQPLRNVQFHQVVRDLSFEKQETQTSANPADPASQRQVIETTDAHYLATRLRLLCLEAAQKGVYRTAETQQTDREIVALAQREKWVAYPAVRLYLTALELLTKPETDAHYHDFKKLIGDFAPAFLPEEMRECYLFAINHCVRRVNEGIAAFGSEALELYRKALGGGFLFENGFLSRFTFHNIVAMGLRSGELEWVEKFIQEFKDRLEKKYRDSSFSFNLARLEQAHVRHGSVLQLLQNANYRDPLLHLSAKILLLKTCHEIGATDLMQAHLDAMRNYINRSEVIGYHRTNYLNIVRFLEKVLQTNRLDKKAVEKLRAQIEREKVLTERAWLLECLVGKAG